MTDAPSKKVKRNWQPHEYKAWNEALTAAGSVKLAASIIRSAPLGHVENDDARDPLITGTSDALLDIFYAEDQEQELRNAARKTLCDAFAFAMLHLGDPNMDVERWLKLLTDEIFCRRLAAKTYTYEFNEHKLTARIFHRIMKHPSIVEQHASSIARGIVTLWPRYEQEAQRHLTVGDVAELPQSARRRVMDELKVIALSESVEWPNDQASNLIEATNFSFEQDERRRAADLYFAIRIMSKAKRMKKLKEDERHKQFELGKKLKELNKLRDSLSQNPLTADSLPKVEKEIAQIQAQMSA